MKTIKIFNCFKKWCEKVNKKYPKEDFKLWDKTLTLMIGNMPKEDKMRALDKMQKGIIYASRQFAKELNKVWEEEKKQLKPMNRFDIPEDMRILSSLNFFLTYMVLAENKKEEFKLKELVL